MRLGKNAVSRCMLAAVTMLVAGAAAAMTDDIRTYADVTNERSGTVSVIDVATHQVTGNLKVGERPRGITASPDGARLYVSDQGGRLIERDIFIGIESASVAEIVAAKSGGKITVKEFPSSQLGTDCSSNRR